MSIAIAMAPSPAPHDRPSFGEVLSAPAPPSHSHSHSNSPSSLRSAAVPPPPPPAPRSGSGSPRGAPTAHKSSPPSASRSAGGPPKIIVKKEPGSPDIATARHRPRKLDLSQNTIGGGPGTARGPLTARDGGLGIQEVGLACLSPGFVTRDPVMKEHVQRSMDIREHQKQIIEQRRQQQSAKGDGSDQLKDGPFAAKTPGFARKRGAPPGLSIVAPSHEQFAHERVIQSAPLGQTFTGRHAPHPLTRHITNQPSNLASTSHIHHVAANQTNNRLPPIADVFGQGLSGHPDSSQHAMYTGHGRAPLASPHHPPPQQHHQQQQQQHQQSQHPQQVPTPGRPREYKSAEEAQADLAGGRPDRLPKIIHYGGPQPPTPPSPGSHDHHRRPQPPADAHSQSKRRRTEYEEGASPPLGNGRAAQRRGPFGEGRDSPETQEAKRAEFMRICERAWDLFHS